MNKQRGLLVIGVMTLTAISALAAFDWKKVTVESDGHRVYRRVEHDGSVRLSKRLSDKPCVQGRSWGYDRNGIWVDDGCRAVFEYENRDNGRDNGRDRGDRWDNILKPGGSYDTKRITVESNDGKRVYRRVDTSGGVRLTKRLSDSPCVQGRSWGYDRNGVWVDDGCRAEFEVRTPRGGSSGRDPWLPGRGVPNWAIGTWEGKLRGASGMELRIRSDGTLTLRDKGERGEGRRGEVRGDRVDIGDDVFKLEKSGPESIKLTPIRSAAGVLQFNKA